MRLALILMLPLMMVLPFQPAAAQGPIGTNRMTIPKPMPPQAPPKINTTGSVISPYISPNGRALYFAYSRYNYFPELSKKGPPVLSGPNRKGHHANDGNPAWDYDLYVARLNPITGRWNPPVNIRGLNDFRGNCCAMFTEGPPNRIYAQRDIPGYSIDLTMNELDDTGVWSPAVDLPKLINTKYNEENLHVSANDLRFYFTSDRPDGFGGKDIWFSYKKGDGKMAIPDNLGPMINTKDNEDEFWISDTPNKAGNYEAYFTRAGNQIWQTSWNAKTGFTAPTRIEVGSQYASSPSVTADGQKLYYATANPLTETTRIMVSERSSDGKWGPGHPVD